MMVVCDKCGHSQQAVSVGAQWMAPPTWKLWLDGETMTMFCTDSCRTAYKKLQGQWSDLYGHRPPRFRP